MTDIVEIMASRRIVIAADGREIGELGALVANAVLRLCREGAELGELEQREYTRPNGERTTGRYMPVSWLRRLERAVELGAFERLDVGQIVARILQPQPGAQT